MSVTDAELRAEVDEFLAQGGRGECEENDGTPEGTALWEWQHSQVRFPVEDPRFPRRPWRP